MLARFRCGPFGALLVALVTWLAFPCHEAIARQYVPEDIAAGGSWEYTGTLTPPPTRYSLYATKDAAFATGTLGQASNGGVSVWREGTVAWQTTYFPTNAIKSWGVAVTCNPNGDTVIVAGVMETAYGKDVIVVAYDDLANAMGPAFKWAQRYSNAAVLADDVPVQVVADNTYVYVAGNSKGGTLLGSSTGDDYFVMKLNQSNGASAWGTQSNGCPWAARYNGPASGNDTIAEMAVTTSSGGQTNGGGTPPPAAAYIYLGGTSDGGGTAATDYAVVRVDAPTGTSMLSARTALTGNETCTSLAVGQPAGGGTGRVFLTGFATTATSSTVDYVTWAYSLSLVPDANWPATGATFDGGGIDEARKIVYSPTDDSVVVTGASWQGTQRKYDIATLKLNAFDGSTSWAGSGVQYFPGSASSGDDQPMDMVIDVCGSVYIGGFSDDAVTGTTDFLGVCYMPLGSLRWNETISGQQYITHDGTGSGTDKAFALRVAIGSGGIVEWNGSVYLFGSTTAIGGVAKYGLARFQQTDPPSHQGCN